MLVAQRSIEWSGPLPPPAALEAFENVAPGSAAKIVAEFQAEAAHRRQQERWEGLLTIGDTIIGRLSAMLFAAGGFGVTYVAIVNDSPWVGSIVGGGMIVSGMAVLLRSRKG